MEELKVSSQPTDHRLLTTTSYKIQKGIENYPFCKFDKGRIGEPFIELKLT